MNGKSVKSLKVTHLLKNIFYKIYWLLIYRHIIIHRVSMRLQIVAGLVLKLDSHILDWRWVLYHR